MDKPQPEPKSAANKAADRWGQEQTVPEEFSFTIANLRVEMSKNNRPYGVIKTTNEENVIAFSDTVDMMTEGGEYTVWGTWEEGRNGKVFKISGKPKQELISEPF